MRTPRVIGWRRTCLEPDCSDNPASSIDRDAHTTEPVLNASGSRGNHDMHLILWFAAGQAGELLADSSFTSWPSLEGLAAAKAKGKPLVRPKGALGKSKLDGKEKDIRMLLGKEVSKASIAKILDVSRSALYHFIETRKIATD